MRYRAAMAGAVLLASLGAALAQDAASPAMVAVLNRRSGTTSIRWPTASKVAAEARLASM